MNAHVSVTFIMYLPNNFLQNFITSNDLQHYKFLLEPQISANNKSKGTRLPHLNTVIINLKSNKNSIMGNYCLKVTDLNIFKFRIILNIIFN